MTRTRKTFMAALLLGATLAQSPAQEKTAPAGVVPRGGPPRVVAEHKSPVLALAWSADGRWLASGAQDGSVRVTEAATGKEIQKLSTGGGVTSLAFSADAKLLAVCQAEAGKVNTWDPTSGKHVREFGNVDGTAEAVAITPDKQSVEAVGVGRIWTWQINGGGGGSMMSNLGPGGAAGMSPDGAAMGWCDGRGFLQIRQIQPGKQAWMGISTSLSIGKARCLAFGPGGKVIAVGDDKGVQLWDTAARRKTRALVGLDTPASRLTFSADGKTLAGLVGDGTRIVVWDLTRDSQRCRIHHSGGGIRALALSPDGKWLATAAKGDRAVFLAKTAPRELVARGTPLSLSAQEMDALWNDLASQDPVKADAAWHKLGEAGENAIPFLREKIRPIAAPAVDLAKIEKSVTDLGSEKYAARERATRDLLEAGELAVAPLQRLLTKKPSPEAVKRAEYILAKVSEPVRTPDRTRVIEAVGLLEREGSAPAVALLREIERDALYASIRGEARLALERVQK